METTQNKNKETQPTVFSLEQLNRIGNNDEEFTAYMLNKFVIIASECAENMRSAITNNDWTRLKTIAHKNITSYSVMGLDELVELLKFIESNSHNEEEHEQLSEFVKLVYDKNNKVITAIEDYLKVLENNKIKTDD